MEKSNLGYCPADSLPIILFDADNVADFDGMKPLSRDSCLAQHVLYSWIGRCELEHSVAEK
jgi:hypothetical protein